MSRMNIALVVGCARSGTSILGELIASHPGVTYIFEAHDVWESAGLGENECHRLTAQHATPEVCVHIRKTIANMVADRKAPSHGAPWAQAWSTLRRLWPGNSSKPLAPAASNDSVGMQKLIVEKCPRNVLRVPFLRQVFPQAKFIHIIRDGRDVACSLMPGAGHDDWNHLRPPSWQELLRDHRGSIRCGLAWKEILEIALRDLEQVSHLEIRYEDLVRDPRKAAGQLMNYLDLPMDPAVLTFCDRISDSTENSYQARGQVQWYVDNHKVRLGRWRDLPAAEQRTLNQVLAPMLRRLGYETGEGGAHETSARAG